VTNFKLDLDAGGKRRGGCLGQRVARGMETFKKNNKGNKGTEMSEVNFVGGEQFCGDIEKETKNYSIFIQETGGRGEITDETTKKGKRKKKPGRITLTHDDSRAADYDLRMGCLPGRNSREETVI